MAQIQNKPISNSPDFQELKKVIIAALKNSDPIIKQLVNKFGSHRIMLFQIHRLANRCLDIIFPRKLSIMLTQYFHCKIQDKKQINLASKEYKTGYPGSLQSHSHQHSAKLNTCKICFRKYVYRLYRFYKFYGSKRPSSFSHGITPVKKDASHSGSSRTESSSTLESNHLLPENSCSSKSSGDSVTKETNGTHIQATSQKSQAKVNSSSQTSSPTSSLDSYRLRLVREKYKPQWDKELKEIQDKKIKFSSHLKFDEKSIGQRKPNNEQAACERSDSATKEINGAHMQATNQKSQAKVNSISKKSSSTEVQLRLAHEKYKAQLNKEMKKREVKPKQRSSYLKYREKSEHQNKSKEKQGASQETSDDSITNKTNEARIEITDRMKVAIANKVRKLALSISDRALELYRVKPSTLFALVQFALQKYKPQPKRREDELIELLYEEKFFIEEKPNNEQTTSQKASGDSVTKETNGAPVRTMYQEMMAEVYSGLQKLNHDALLQLALYFAELCHPSKEIEEQQDKKMEEKEDKSIELSSHQKSDKEVIVQVEPNNEQATSLQSVSLDHSYAIDIFSQTNSHTTFGKESQSPVVSFKKELLKSFSYTPFSSVESIRNHEKFQILRSLTSTQKTSEDRSRSRVPRSNNNCNASRLSEKPGRSRSRSPCSSSNSNDDRLLEKPFSETLKSSTLHSTQGSSKDRSRSRSPCNSSNSNDDRLLVKPFSETPKSGTLPSTQGSSKDRSRSRSPCSSNNTNADKLSEKTQTLVSFKQETLKPFSYTPFSNTESVINHQSFQSVHSLTSTQESNVNRSRSRSPCSSNNSDVDRLSENPLSETLKSNTLHVYRI